ncbi:hypothetical protein TEA_004772 [Camellia sinensis var. sinensis]|uniref:Core-2/I-branching beta-1,6-N-acetylglucosaminyltransferase family protein n=1 Tax=Camellia sinensis var. sinensis TaxID=542762 RepID=A0A4S4D312_CAMSN|nr:hypothetical protein TEA_004772 [Camellia sinensis var. sinensis]
MAKKTSLPPPISKRKLLWFSWKLVIALSISLCVLALLRLQHYSQSQLSFPSSSSSLVVRRSRILNSQFEGPPKVAFLFLTRRNLPLDVLWGCFFENADVGNFSIYIHSEPGFVFDESTTRSAFFYNRQLTNMIKVAWGEASMIQAERLLLGAALEDPANQRFVLLSDSKSQSMMQEAWVNVVGFCLKHLHLIGNGPIMSVGFLLLHVSCASFGIISCACILIMTCWGVCGGRHAAAEDQGSTGAGTSTVRVRVRVRRFGKTQKKYDTGTATKGLMEVLRSWGGGGGQMGKRCCKASALAPLCLMWLLWLERNLRVFQGVVRSASCLEDRFFCVPLYNFSYIYNNLMASPRSFVDSFLDEKEGRYNPTMSPVIPKNKWRKGSQWVSLVRGHAEIVVDDEVIFPVFKKFCKRRPPLDASKGKQNIKLQKQHNCIPDEHYVQTLLAMSDLEGELERRTVTYTLWNHSATNMERKGWHPITFSYANASPQQIKRIKDITQVYYETEQRTEWCSNNSTRVPCFLFGRKFSKGAAVRLVTARSQDKGQREAFWGDLTPFTSFADRDHLERRWIDQNPFGEDGPFCSQTPLKDEAALPEIIILRSDDDAPYRPLDYSSAGSSVLGSGASGDDEAPGSPMVSSNEEDDTGIASGIKESSNGRDDFDDDDDALGNLLYSLQHWSLFPTT